MDDVIEFVETGKMPEKTEYTDEPEKKETNEDYTNVNFEDLDEEKTE